MNPECKGGCGRIRVLRISCRMCLDERETFIPMEQAKGKAVCPRCDQNLADAIVLDETFTAWGYDYHSACPIQEKAHQAWCWSRFPQNKWALNGG